MTSARKGTAAAPPDNPAQVPGSNFIPGLGYFLQGTQASIKIRRLPRHAQQKCHSDRTDAVSAT